MTTVSSEANESIDYSIVIPVFFNEGTLKKTYHTLRNKVIARNQDKNSEVIFVDDGSGDGSLAELMQLKEEYPEENIKIIKFTRNFGQVSAIRAGYQLAKGKCMINISADLQDPPELINQMLDHFYKNNYEVVVCSRSSRDEPFLKRKTSRLFYGIIKKLSFSNMPVGGFDYVLISNKVKKIILDRPEANPFWQGQILWPGYEIKFIPYKRSKREVGKSRWTFSKKVKYLIDGVMSYSYLPLRLISIVGMLLALGGFLYALIIFFAKIFGGIPAVGWAPLMIVILILSGIQMLMLGVIGEYLWRTLDQVRNRPPYIIEKIYD
ncbi:MAG: glycosyltransferase [Candidatus Aminicenantes bacterium]|nr:glycosyltransferase [Candidatus Aminicenantes bacterium]NIM82166.1 glycosyltransferase [Candidatus Aminicenantes bacterium]NIN21567.1 glycosyltransferase [Candidatus Aminicenantes bacterium]NIN45376.1 glycosyltransferase [Candidatus Aminicenantes bacterium]NIN88197.1 glycosyltransferase [Candidatus Aminicenantes bacterium]